MVATPTSHLTAFDKDKKRWNVVIETPRACRNKFKYDSERGLFSLSGVLPSGMSFPYDFGFLPGTLGEDGDPLDVLLLMDEPAFVGCLVPARLIGVIEAKQTEDGKTTRNDRLVACAANCHNYSDVKNVKDLNDNLLHEIEQFFVSYNQTRGKKFKVLACKGPSSAEALAKEGMKRAEKKTK